MSSSDSSYSVTDDSWSFHGTRVGVSNPSDAVIPTVRESWRYRSSDPAALKGVVTVSLPREAARKYYPDVAVTDDADGDREVIRAAVRRCVADYIDRLYRTIG